MNFCPDGGFIVDGDGEVPDDPTAHAHELLPAVGCNRLRCSTCGVIVRTARGVALDNREVSKPAVYEAPDITKAPGMVSTLPAFRFYICRDHALIAKEWSRLDEKDPDVRVDLGVPWRCSGHPVVELPHTFDGVVVNGDADLVDLVNRAAKQRFVPPGAPAEVRRGAVWLARLYHWLEGSRWQDVLAGAAAALLDDADAKVRGYALQFFVSAPALQGMRRVLEILEGDRAGYAGVKDEVTRNDDDPTLEHSLWRVVHELIGQNERALQLARKEVVTPGKGGRAVYAPLARHDSEWLLENAGKIARVNPQNTDALLKAAEYNLPPSADYDVLKERIQAIQPKA